MVHMQHMLYMLQLAGGPRILGRAKVEGKMPRAGARTTHNVNKITTYSTIRSTDKTARLQDHQTLADTLPPTARWSHKGAGGLTVCK